MFARIPRFGFMPRSRRGSLGSRPAVMVLTCSVALGGCVELDVTNENAPDRDEALQSPSDLEGLIGGAFNSWWRAGHGETFAGAFSSASDELTASWGFLMLNEFGQEPRIPIPNSPNVENPSVVEGGWALAYAAIVAASDGLAVLDGGAEIGPGGQDNLRARAFARFVQGLAHGTLALVYDRAFVIDEATDPDATLELQLYGQVMEAAIGYLEQALDLSQSSSFTLPAEWISGNPLSNEELAALTHSYLARFKASVARTPAERASADWVAIAAHADQGIERDFAVQGDGNVWTSVSRLYFPINWIRMDMRMLGNGDTSGRYQAWEQTAPEERQPFLISTVDERLPNEQEDGRYIRYYPADCCPPDRGTWYLSPYNDNQYVDILAAGSVGPLLEMAVDEMRLLRAEALMRIGDDAGAAELVNVTRFGEGGLPPVTADGDTGDPCIPRMADGSCGDLFEALKYEKRLETYYTGPGLSFFDDRGWGDLVPGTPLHLPIPAKELSLLEMEVYTFGGVGNEGSAAASRSTMSGRSLRATLQAVEQLHRKYATPDPELIRAKLGLN